jgi:hypothetical protein
VLEGLFTAVDDELSGEILSDPLGITRLWSHLGNMLIPFFTQRTWHIRQFTLALLTYRIQNGDIIQIPKDGVFTHSFILGLEQLVSYLQARENGDRFDGFVGKRRAMFTFRQGITNVTVGGRNEDLIITTQRSAGACAVMNTMFRAMKLYDENEGIVDTVFSDQFLNAVDINWREIIAQATKRAGLTDLFSQPYCEITLGMQGGGAGKQELIKFFNGSFRKAQKLLEEKMLQLDSTNYIAAVLNIANKLKEKKVETSTNNVMNALRKKDGKIGRLAEIICASENLFCNVETLFEALSHSKNFLTIEPYLSDKMVSDINSTAKTIYNETKSEEIMETVTDFCSHFMYANNKKELVHSIVEQHTNEMKSQRQQSSWVHLREKEVFATDLVCDKSNEIKKRLSQRNNWRHFYYVPALLGLVGY